MALAAAPAAPLSFFVELFAVTNSPVILKHQEFSKFATTLHHENYLVGQKVKALTSDPRSELSHSEFVHLFKKYTMGINYVPGSV